MDAGVLYIWGHLSMLELSLFILQTPFNLALCAVRVISLAPAPLLSTFVVYKTLHLLLLLNYHYIVLARGYSRAVWSDRYTYLCYSHPTARGSQ